MLNKENAELIEKMNEALGSKHRSTPYDLTNADDLKHALLLTVSAFMDYLGYYLRLENISEELDESIEYYDPVTWLNMTRSSDDADDLALDAVGTIIEASDLMYNMSSRAQKNCCVILKAILQSPQDVQTKVLDCAFNIPKEQMDDELENLFEEIAEIEIYYNMEENLEAFLKHMKSQLAKWLCTSI